MFPSDCCPTSAPFLCCRLPFSMTSEVSYSHNAVDLTVYAANNNKNGAPESAAVEPEPFEAEHQ